MSLFFASILKFLKGVPHSLWGGTSTKISRL
jgi:hypothetical protein